MYSFRNFFYINEEEVSVLKRKEDSCIERQLATKTTLCGHKYTLQSTSVSLNKESISIYYSRRAPLITNVKGGKPEDTRIRKGGR